jgi:hypothetical protein
MMISRGKLDELGEKPASTKNLKCSYPGLNLGLHSKETVSSFFCQIKSECKYLFHVASAFQQRSISFQIQISTRVTK